MLDYTRRWLCSPYFKITLKVVVINTIAIRARISHVFEVATVKIVQQAYISG